MLDAYLYEMSKQRFHFVVQCQWESKLFLQKQKRKTAVMRDLLRNVDTSALFENPFSTKSREAKSIQTQIGQKRHRVKSSKSLLNFKQPFDERRSKTVASETFITSQKQTEDFCVLELNKKTSQAKNWMWPIHDDRYVKLSEVLCDTYPKVASLQASRKHYAF